MITREEITELLGKYDLRKLAIGTIGSHSAPQHFLKEPRKRALEQSAFAGKKTLLFIRSFHWQMN